MFAKLQEVGFIAFCIVVGLATTAVMLIADEVEELLP